MNDLYKLTKKNWTHHFRVFARVMCPIFLCPNEGGFGDEKLKMTAQTLTFEEGCNKHPQMNEINVLDKFYGRKRISLSKEKNPLCSK